MIFESKCKKMGGLRLDIPFQQEYLYMHPIYLHNFKGLPNKVNKFNDIIEKMINLLPLKKGKSYITLDRKYIKKGESHRRGGAHIDGNYCFGWGGSGWSCGTQGRYLPSDKHLLQYGQKTGGMLIVSDKEACQVWEGKILGMPGQGGDCNHLRNQFNNLSSFKMKPHNVYWINSMGIHESLPLQKETCRTLIRLTLPKDYISLK